MSEKKSLEMSHNGEAERAVLGSILLLGGKGVDMINHLISDEDFYFRSHSLIYTAMLDLNRNGTAIDVVTVSDALVAANWLEDIGGASAITGLASEVATGSKIVHYAKIVQHHSALRRVLVAARRVAELSQDKKMPLRELLTKAEHELHQATNVGRLQEDKLEIVDLNDWMKIARETRAAPGIVEGLSTGLFKIDKMTQGFVPGELMIVSGQTSHGKTQLCNNIMKKASDIGKKTMFVTMEMTKREIGERFNFLTDDNDIGENKIFLNARSDLAYTDVTKIIERAKERGCDLVVIDHLHYFSRSVENATQEISKIVKEFKSAAVQYEIPVILICHVRKMAPKKHPTLEDLRDSSLIAQDADIVLIVWRDESPGAQEPNKVEVTLWKNRNRQKKHRREFLYADGLKLTEDEPSYTGHRDAIEHTNRILGERDNDEEDLSIEGEDWKASFGAAIGA